VRLLRSGTRAQSGLALRVVGCVGAALILSCVAVRPVLAEFEIPEVNVEQGSISAEYRGAAHEGVPQPKSPDDAEDSLWQSHELEFQLAPSDYWMFRITPGLRQEIDQQLEFTDFGIETQFVLHPRAGNGLGAALIVGYTDHFDTPTPEPAEFEIGPVVEYAAGPWLLTLNPMFTADSGPDSDDPRGLEYASQLQYRIAKHWALAGLAFGQIDDLEHSGSFEDQIHRAGPTIYWLSGDEDDDADGDGDEAESATRKAVWKIGIGTLFGLTRSTPDVSFKVMSSIDY
jgi:hypothetical protein